MTKSTFMLKLNTKLVFDLPFSEIKKINSEYNGYFSEGIKSGKNEEQIINEIGTPSLVTTEILSERGSLYADEISNKLLKIVLVAVLLILTLLSERQLNINNIYQHEEIMLIIIYLLILPTAILFILGGKKLIVATPHVSAQKNKLYFLNTILFLVSFLLPISLYSDLMGYFNGKETFWYNFLLPISQPYDIGGWVSAIFTFIKILLLAMIVINSIYTMKNGRLFLPLIYINFVSLYSIFRHTELLHTMDDPNSIAPFIFFVSKNVLLGAIAVIAVFLIAHFILKFLKRGTVK